ncbi:hypothetical protein [Empedobacter tilapiae]
MMKNSILLIFILNLTFSCKVSHLETDNSTSLQYYKAYDTIMSVMAQDKYLNDVKLRNGDDFIKYYIMKDIYIQNREDKFDLENIYQKDGLLELSKRYSKGKLNQYQFPILPKNIKKYKGPNLFIYFSNIENDSLKVDIFNNPYAKYSKTSIDKFLIVFDSDSIKLFNYWKDYYD